MQSQATAQRAGKRNQWVEASGDLHDRTDSEKMSPDLYRCALAHEHTCMHIHTVRVFVSALFLKLKKPGLVFLWSQMPLPLTMLNELENPQGGRSLAGAKPNLPVHSPSSRQYLGLPMPCKLRQDHPKCHFLLRSHLREVDPAFSQSWAMVSHTDNLQGDLLFPSNCDQFSICNQ